MERNIKIRLLQIGKTQQWLLAELKRIGYLRIDPECLSAIIDGHKHGLGATAILDAAEDIIKQYEKSIMEAT